VGPNVENMVMMGSDSGRKTSWHVHHVVSGNLTCLTPLTKSSQVCIISSFVFPYWIRSFWLFWFSSCVFTLASTCLLTYCGWISILVYIYIYIYRFLFYLLEVVTSNQGCASILFIQKYLSITNKSILYYLH